MKKVCRNQIVAAIILSSLSFGPASLADSTAFNKEVFINSAKEKKIFKISLQDCISYALEKNSEIRIQRIDPKLADYGIKIAESGFEPALNAEYSVYNSRQLSPLENYPDALETESTQFNIDISGKLLTGTRYTIDFLNDKNETNLPTYKINPYYTTKPQISLTQPLLKGFGLSINRAAITIAKNNKQMSEETFKNIVIETITNTQIAYYNYLYSLENYAIAKAALEMTEDLRTINKARYEKGLISSVDLLETETAVAQKEKILISAESVLKAAEDNLKLITNLVDELDAWNAELELTSKPELKIRKIDLVESLILAFEGRPDYIAAKTGLANHDLKIKTAKDSLFPSVDLIGSFALNGLSDTYKTSRDNLNSDYKDWSAGIKVSIPWGKGDRAVYNQTKLQKEQALIAFKRLEQKIILEVREKVRDIDIKYRQVKANELSREKERENYQAQKERYIAGQVSTHNMLDYQDRLAQAELDYSKALIDYNTALAMVGKAIGTTLKENNIQLDL